MSQFLKRLFRLLISGAARTVRQQEAAASIFISHASADKQAVRVLYNRLTRAGFNPWLDEEDLLPGEDWTVSIRKAVTQSDFFLACLSNQSISGKGFLQRELKYALDMVNEIPGNDIYLIPIRLEPCSIPKELRRFQSVDLFEKDGWDLLLKSLEGGLERRREKSPDQMLMATSLSDIANVTDRLEGTIDVPTELTSEWRSAVQRFDKASISVGQYLALHSEYRKGEALENALSEIESLQHTLVNAKGWFALRLLRVARQWRRLLEEEREVFLAKAKATHEIPNPYIYGNPVAETEYNIFTGRKDIVRNIEEGILGAIEAPTLLLHGARRMGKTSILNQLPRLLGSTFAPAIVDCQNPAAISSLASLLEYISSAISKNLRRRRVIIEPPTIESLERYQYTTFNKWLNQVERAMPRGLRILLCLDEYERLKTALDKEWGESLLDFMRHIIQHRPRIVVMFTGVHTFAELGPAWTDRFISVRRIRISFLTREEVEPLLLEPIPSFGMTYAPGALDAIFSATNGHPFLTQAVAFELVEFLNQKHRQIATVKDVEEAINRALTSADAYFANVWSDAGEKGRAFLSAMVRGEARPDSPTVRSWLQEQDVLSSADQFTVPVVEQWVRTKAQKETSNT